MKLKIGEIIKVCEGVCFDINNKACFNGVSIDSRTIKKGNLFIAISGDRTNGHDFVEEALSKGAIGFILDNKYKVQYKDIKNVIFVKDTFCALHNLAQYYLDKTKVKPILITGSSGKTTVKDMLYYVLKDRFKVIKTLENLNNCIGVPLTIFRLKGNEEYCIIEAGINKAKELDLIGCTVRPNFGLITNIGKSHLKYLKTVNRVLRAKWEFVKFIKKKGFLIINGDDKLLYAKTLKTKNNIFKIYKFGKNNFNDCIGEIKEKKDLKQTIGIKVNKDKYEIKNSVLGNAGLYNNLAVISVCVCLGLKREYIIRKLSNYKSQSKMRFEIMKTNKNISIVNDTYNANPDSTKEGINIFSSLRSKGRKVVVLGDMLELGVKSKNEHERIGKQLFNSNISYVFLYGNYVKYIYEVLKKNNYKNVFYYKRKLSLARKLKNICKKDDSLYFKGSRGMKLEEVVERLLKQSFWKR